MQTEALGEDDPNAGSTLLGLASLYQAMGDYPTARSHYQRTLSIWENAIGLNNLASAYSDKGDYTEALPLYEQALALAEETLGESHPQTAARANNLANIYRLQGNYEAALPLFQRAVDIWESIDESYPTLSIGLNNLAGEYERRGNIALARDLYSRVIAVVEASAGEDHPNVATAVSNLAVLELRQYNYSAAIPLLDRALTITKTTLGEDHPDVATLLGNLVNAYQKQGDYETSLSLAKQSLSVAEDTLGELHPITATSLKTLGLIHWDMGEFDQVTDLLARMSTVEETLLSDTLLSASEIRRQRYIDTLAASTSLYITGHLNANPDSEMAAQLAMDNLLRRKGRVLDAASNSSQRLRQNLDPAEQQQLDELNLLRTQLANLRFDGLDGRSVNEYLAQLSSLERRAEQIEEALARRSAEFAIASQPVSTAAIQSQIPTNAALIEFVKYQTYLANSQKSWGNVRYAAYVMTSEGKIEAVDLGEADTIDALLETFRQSLTTQSANHRDIARQLEERLIAPIRPFLSGKSHLLLSPDSQLNLIPFDALVDTQDRYLIESYQISYLNSGRDLLSLQVDAPSRQTPVVIANPSYEGSASGAANGQRSVDANTLYFGNLPGTAAEGSAIASLLPAAALLTEQQATESALKQVSAPSVLHIATHGFFLPDVDFVVPDANSRAASFELIDVEAPAQVTPSNLENPLLRSGLAFAGANSRSSGSEDGIFTALEASGLDLYGTELVVLSACDTGVGAASSGEGVYGLRRAFAIAGAESQLMSLWQVDDTGTSELMQIYYQNLIEKKQGRSEALRNAQMELLNTGTYQHPYYWSSFIFSGDWRPLE
jgi:CHAT domain-containing protein/Tfp pilus assembly protein PilF